MAYNRREFLQFGLSIAVGLGGGAAIEAHTDEVARGKIVTAQACYEQYKDVDATITPGTLKCLSDGVPGGREIHSHVLHVGQPIEYVESYIRAQQAEANDIELNRLLGWTLLATVVGAGEMVYDFVRD
ncbi:MAG TPA: hypothetical protein VG992_04615 [Candidatus Saccharimonadales bacterium]|nr:hypothetical protein [Candidatus Saccharimonadales bacterium]